MPNFLVSLSENDKRLIFSLLLVIILIIVLVGYLGYLTVKIMKWQAKKIDTLTYDVVTSKVITDRKHLLKYGRNKNWTYFFKQAYIPLLIILFAFIILIIHNSITDDWSYQPFSTYNGFGTVFWTWKLSDDFTDGTLIRFNRLVVDNTPHLIAEAWAGYIFGPCILVGGAWYFVVASSFLARTILLYKRSKEIFEKSLEGFRQNETKQQSETPEQTPESKPAETK